MLAAAQVLAAMEGSIERNAWERVAGKRELPHKDG